MYRIYTAIAIPIIFISMGLLAWGLYVLLKNKNNKIKNLPFIMISVVFLCLETSKQIYEFCRPDGYRLYSIPLHLCSFFVFFPIFAACLKQEWRITKIFWSLSINCALIVSIAMLVAPEIIIGLQTEAVMKATGTYIEYHSVIHHVLIVLYAFLAIFFKPWKPNVQESVGATCVLGGFLLLAWIMANILDTDFASFIRFGTGFFMQLAVWSVHLICFAVSSLIVWGTEKIHLNKIAKKEEENQGENV